MSTSTQCLDCKHYTGMSTCNAYPDGIPQEIFDGRVIHTEPYPGDDGVMYDPIDIELIPDQFERVVVKLADSGSLSKSEKGVKTEWRTVTRGGKTFKQRFRVGQKETNNDGVIDKWLAEKIEPIKDDINALGDEFRRIQRAARNVESEHTPKEYFDSVIGHPSLNVRGSVVSFLDDDSKHELVDDPDSDVRFAVGYYTHKTETIKQLAHDEDPKTRDIVRPKYYVSLLKPLSEKFLAGEDVEFDETVVETIKSMSYENKDTVNNIHKGLDGLYSANRRIDGFNKYSKEEWLQSSNNTGSAVLKFAISKLYQGTKIQHHDAIDLNDAETMEGELDKLPDYSVTNEDIIKYIKLQHKLTKKLLDIKFPDQDEFVVYRGTTRRECGNIDAKVGDSVEIEQNPISSWTLGKETAQKFAEDENGVVIKMTISKDDIWSSFLTHSYSTFEQEMVVIGKEGTTAEIVEFGTAPASHGGMFTTGQDSEDEDYEYDDEESWY